MLVYVRSGDAFLEEACPIVGAFPRAACRTAAALRLEDSRDGMTVAAPDSSSAYREWVPETVVCVAGRDY
jgi:hypothetical protein